MSVFMTVFVAMLAALGVALLVLELFRFARAKRARFVCLCFDDDFSKNRLPDMLVICRSYEEEEEIIRRISAEDPRRMFVKYI